MWKLSRRFGSSLRHLVPKELLDKQKGQHLLVSDSVLANIVDFARLKATDSVLEIGAGSGNLTLRLLKRCGKLYAVDIDPVMVSVLHKRAKREVDSLLQSKLQLAIGDALHIALPKVDTVVANVPYQISSELLFKLLCDCRWKTAVLLLQREFVDKMVAKPRSKQYSRLSVNTALHCSVQRMAEVSPQCFEPKPKVHSTVVRITPKPKPLRNTLLRKRPVDGRSIESMQYVDTATDTMQLYLEWDCFLKTCFSRKNKKLESIWRNSDCAKVLPVLRQLNLGHLRANGIHCDRFVELFVALKQNGVEFDFAECH